MTMLRILVLCVLLLPLSAVADSYICVTDHMNGFVGKDNWKPTVLTTKFKYVVRPMKPGDFLYDELNTKLTYVVLPLGGDNVPVSSCDNDFDFEGFLKCDGRHHLFGFLRHPL